jgi:hypothetical protein
MGHGFFSRVGREATPYHSLAPDPPLHHIPLPERLEDDRRYQAMVRAHLASLRGNPKFEKLTAAR